MRVMAKLSLKVHDALGEDVLDQLVAWINQVYDYRRGATPLSPTAGSADTTAPPWRTASPPGAPRRP